MFFSTRYDQVIFSNKCLPTIPIIHPSKFVYMKEEHIQFFPWLQFISPSNNNYCIRHINSFFDQIYKNRYIYLILYTNQHDKSLFAIIRVLSWSYYVNSFGLTYLQQWLLVRLIIYNIILSLFNKFVIINYVIWSSNMLLYHCF